MNLPEGGRFLVTYLYWSVVPSPRASLFEATLVYSGAMKTQFKITFADWMKLSSHRYCDEGREPRIRIANTLPRFDKEAFGIGTGLSTRLQGIC
jgi:hypothetical protein